MRIIDRDKLLEAIEGVEVLDGTEFLTRIIEFDNEGRISLITDSFDEAVKMLDSYFEHTFSHLSGEIRKEFDKKIEKAKNTLYSCTTEKSMTIEIPFNENADTGAEDLHLDLILFWNDLKNFLSALSTASFIKEIDTAAFMANTYKEIPSWVKQRLGYEENIASREKLSEKTAKLIADKELFHLAMTTERGKIFEERMLFDFLRPIKEAV